MSRKTERLALILLDCVTVNAAFAVYYLLRIRSGFFEYAIEPEVWAPMIVIYAYWLLWFAFFGLYRHWYAQSRLDEVMTLFRTSAVGTLVLFFLVLIDDQSSSSSSSARELILAYWIMLFLFVSMGRLSIRAIQKRLLESGIGTRNTLIIGWSAKARELCDMVLKYPALGYRLIGFVQLGKRVSKRRKPLEYQSIRVLGSLDALPRLLVERQVQEVLVGLDSTEHDQLLEIIRYCDGREVGMKIIPDLYDIVSGQARISSIYGFPLIEVNPIIMKPWEEAMKRFIDMLVATTILLAGLPVWVLVAAAVKLDSPGAVFYSQERVGKNGKAFSMMKFRSMRTDAERTSGPKWAEKNDPRVTRMGKIMRRLHVDEVPQFINVLLGDMSLVGPRPERAYFVDQLDKELPLYRRRLRVRPGITGWAQIKYRYDQSVEDVKSKLKYDLFYIENMSWRMDLKILFNTLYVMLRGKGHT